MPLGHANFRDDSTFRPRVGGRHAAQGVRFHDQNAVLPSSSDTGHRSGSAHSAGDEIRLLSILEDLLFPLLGNLDDASQAADALITRFGSIARILEADVATLRDALGNRREVAAALIAARQLVYAGWNEWAEGSAVDIDDPRLRDHFLARLQSNREERMLAVFLDRNGGFLHEEMLATGDFNGVSLRKRKLVQRLLDHNAHGVLLAHNHPSGDPRPSDVDRDSTEKLCAILEPLEIYLLDHLIIARGRVFSMKRQVLL